MRPSFRARAVVPSIQYPGELYAGQTHLRFPMITDFTRRAERTLRAANRPLSAASTIDNYSTSPVSEDHPPRPTHPGSRQRLGPVNFPHSPTGRPKAWGPRPEIREAEAGGPARTPHARFRALSNLTHDCRCSRNSLKISIRQATVLPPGDGGGGGGDRRLPVPVARHGRVRRPPGRDPAHFALRIGEQ